MKCACGCGNHIIPQKHHSYYHPKFIHGHNLSGGEFKKGHGYGNRFKKGERSAGWKCGRIIDDDGYILIWKPEHHFADSKGYFREHRLVIEEYYNCSLLPYTIIHHIDGNKQNNIIENLMLMTQSEHFKLHIKIR